MAAEPEPLPRPPSRSQDAWKISRNQELVSLHVDDARAFARSVSAHAIPGDTIVFDFVYFLHPVRGEGAG